MSADRSLSHVLVLSTGCSPSTRPRTPPRGEARVTLPWAADEEAAERREGGATLEGRVVELTLLSNWGDQESIGLSALCLAGPDGEAVPVPGHAVEVFYDLADSADSTEPPPSPPPRAAAEQLFSTRADDGGPIASAWPMWTVRFPRGYTVRLLVDLGSTRQLGSLRVWNYTAGGESHFVGAKRLRLVVDGQCVEPRDGTAGRVGAGPHAQAQAGYRTGSTVTVEVEEGDCGGF